MNRKLLAAGLISTVFFLVVGCGTSATQISATPADSHAHTATPTGPAAPAENGRYKILSESSSASYGVKESFLKQNLNTTAVGRTSVISGDLIVQADTLKPSTVTVDLSTLTSDNSKRDDSLKTKGLHTSTYPLAVFTITGVEGGLPIFGEAGEPAFKLTGSMTIHGTTRPFTFNAVAVAEGESIRLSAVAHFNMTDFGLEPPNVLGLISVEEEVHLEVEIVARLSL